MALPINNNINSNLAHDISPFLRYVSFPLKSTHFS